MTIPFDHLFWSYRLAKFEVAAERRGLGRLAFARFENDLAANLRKLQPSTSDAAGLFRSVDPGAVWVRPKSIVQKQNGPGDGSSFIWVPERDHDHQIQEMSVRVLLEPTPEFAISEVLWLRAFGPALDAVLAESCLGNRLYLKGEPAQIPVGGRRIYHYWAPAYQRFRANAIKTAKSCLLDGNRRCVLLTLDLNTYYDSIDPSFLLDEKFIETVVEAAANVDVPFDTAAYHAATEGLLQGFAAFRAKIRRVVGVKRDCGIPIGSLTARLIANLALAVFDHHVERIPGVRYYARYVDDILIVHEPEDDLPASASTEVGRFVNLDALKTRADRLVIDENAVERPGSSFVIQAKKLRVFDLRGDQGLEYLVAVEAEMQRVSSERRRFLDPRAEELDYMIMASPNAEPIRALRQADALSLRRLAVSTMSDKVSTAAAMLDRAEAANFSRRFLGKVGRLATDWSRWVDLIDVSLRVLGSALISGDEETANEIIDALTARAASLDGGSSPSFGIQWGDAPLSEVSARKKLKEWVEEQLVEVIASATPFDSSGLALPGLRVLKNGIHVRGKLLRGRALFNRAKLLAAADLRLVDRETDQLIGSPHISRPQASVQSLQSSLAQDTEYFSRVPSIQRFLDVCSELRDPTFAPLRPLELLLLFRPPTYVDVLFRWLRSERPIGELTQVVNAIRGTRYSEAPMVYNEDSCTVHIEPPTQPHVGEVRETKLILGNLCTEDAWWEASLTKPTLTDERQQRLTRVINHALDAAKRSDDCPALLVLPELSLPRRWWRQVCSHLARSEPTLSLVAGLEYEVVGKKVYNEALAYFPRPFFSAAMWMWTKRRPAHHEAPELQARGFMFAKRAEDRRFVRVSSEHGMFVPLICSELLEVDTRAQLLGRVDFVLVPAWNPDTTSFEYLVHASALELHSFIAVVNNGLFSDCRIRGPYVEAWRREVCRLLSRGENEVVSAVIPVHLLREYRADPKGYDMRIKEWKENAEQVKKKLKRAIKANKKPKLSAREQKYLEQCPWPAWKPAPPGDSWPGSETGGVA